MRIRAGKTVMKSWKFSSNPGRWSDQDAFSAGISRRELTGRIEVAADF